MVRTILSSVDRCAREPLLQFVVLGALVCGAYRWLAPPPAHRIVLSEEAVNGLRQDYLRRYGRAPTDAEEAGLIRRFVDDEVLYREALSEGLDRGDIIVRRRMVQKMEFIIEGLDPVPSPTDADLEAYLRAHSDRYAVPERVALTHVFVSTDRHPHDAAAVAAALEPRLRAGGDPARLGDPFLRGQHFGLLSQRELAGVFGAAFAARAMSLPVGDWTGPIRSSYGLHLVRVERRTAARAPELAAVRQAVLNDWQAQRRDEIDRAAVARLRRRYDVEVRAPRTDSARLQAPARAGEGRG